MTHRDCQEPEMERQLLDRAKNQGFLVMASVFMDFYILIESANSLEKCLNIPGLNSPTVGFKASENVLESVLDVYQVSLKYM